MTLMQCDQKIFFQIADQRCQNRQEIANNLKKLFKIARILGQNRRSNPAFFMFYCIFITKFVSRPQNLFIFFKKKREEFFWQVFRFFYKREFDKKNGKDKKREKRETVKSNLKMKKRKQKKFKKCQYFAYVVKLLNFSLKFQNRQKSP